ncbi:MAG: type III secretion system chaperone [Puniceicoccales bacterium]|jgi:hypothetical protein|nr:type III secretion system chaperone [Puniceicoccales bacterium]
MDATSLHNELINSFSGMFLFDRLSNVYHFQIDNRSFQFEILDDGKFAEDPVIFISSLLCPINFEEERDAVRKLARALAMNMYFMETDGASIGFESDTLHLAVFEKVTLKDIESAKGLVEFLTKFASKFAGISDTFAEVLKE